MVVKHRNAAFQKTTSSQAKNIGRVPSDAVDASSLKPSSAAHGSDAVGVQGVDEDLSWRCARLFLVGVKRLCVRASSTCCDHTSRGTHEHSSLVRMSAAEDDAKHLRAILRPHTSSLLQNGVVE